MDKTQVRKIKQIDPEIIEAMSKVDYPFYEQHMLDAIRDLGLTGTAIDVGAHVGNHTVYFATQCKFDNVIAFEPNPVAKHVFKDNTKRIENIELIGKALLDTPKYIKLDLNKDLHGQTKVVDCDKSPVYCTSLDVHVSNMGMCISLIKIDVEGREIDVLKGAFNTILKHKPHLFIEHFGDPNKLLQYLPDGYKVGQRYNGAPTYHYYYE